MSLSVVRTVPFGSFLVLGSFEVSLPLANSRNECAQLHGLLRKLECGSPVVRVSSRGLGARPCVYEYSLLKDFRWHFAYFAGILRCAAQLCAIFQEAGQQRACSLGRLGTGSQVWFRRSHSVLFYPRKINNSK